MLSSLSAAASAVPWGTIAHIVGIIVVAAIEAFL